MIREGTSVSCVQTLPGAIYLVAYSKRLGLGRHTRVLFVPLADLDCAVLVWILRSHLATCGCSKAPDLIVIVMRSGFAWKSLVLKRCLGSISDRDLGLVTRHQK